MMTNDRMKAKEEVLWGCQMMVDKGFALGTAGNISARVADEELIVITPTSMAYDTLTAEDLVVADYNGNIVEGKYKPSIELSMHLGIFRLRPDVMAVVHTHSKYATAFSAIGDMDRVPVMDIEGVVYLGGEIVVAPFAPPGSPELAEHVRNTIGTNAGLILANHGALSTGITMLDAMIASDNVERASEMYLAVAATGMPLRKLPEDYLRMAAHKSLVRRNIAEM